MADFGGGDGALCERVLHLWPAAQATCYEPSAELNKQAAEATAGTGVQVVATTAALSDAAYDLVTCCEVFEHLPERETGQALEEFARILKSEGRLVIGVPNEIFAVGFAKGLFRMTRRYGEYDARWGTVLAAARGKPRQDRPHLDIDGLPFIYPHTGFDYRRLIRDIQAHRFVFVGHYCSPFRRAPRSINAEIYLVCTKQG